MSGASNYVARFIPNWQNVNNTGGGCLGMCGTPQQYVCRVLREVDVNRFVQVHQVQGRYNSAQTRMPQQEILLSQLCNDDKNQRIKFAIQNPTTNASYHEATTTVGELEKGKTTLDCGSSCNLRLDNFEVRIKPHFTDYLRSGWQISMTLAVDYTASNGEPSQPGSLHALGPQN